MNQITLKKQTVLMLLLFIFVGSLSAQRLNLQEGRFFTDNISNTITNVTNLTGADNITDSNRLNAIITSVSNSGGGTIVLAPHNGKSTFYFRDVRLKSNVHLKIDKNVTIRPTYNGISATRSVKVFHIGNRQRVDNVAITSSVETGNRKNDAFKVVLPGGRTRGVRFIEIGFARNFRVSGISITDSNTKFSNIVLNLPDNKVRSQIPIKGKIENIFSINNHVGYGIIQAQTAKTVLFKNLIGTGGVTLRLESDVVSPNSSAQTIDDVVGKKIRIKNGDAALTLSPHRVNQGQVDIDGIVAVNSTYAARISAGFIGNFAGSNNVLGTFSNSSYVRVVRVTGGNSAQVKGKDFKFFNCNTRNILKNAFDNGGRNPDNASVPGTSLAIYSDNADTNNGCNSSNNGCYRPTTVLPASNKITGNFERSDRSRAYLYNSDKIRCGRSNSNFSKTIQNVKEENVELSVYPNPAQNILKIKGLGQVTIYDITGNIVRSIDMENGEKLIDISNLSSGFYIVSDEKSQTKKLIVK